MPSLASDNDSISTWLSTTWLPLVFIIFIGISLSIIVCNVETLIVTTLNPPSLVFTPFWVPRNQPRNQSSPLINHQNIVDGVGEYGICALQSLCSVANYMNMGRKTALLSDARRRALRTKDHQVMFEKTILDFFLLVLCWMNRVEQQDFFDAYQSLDSDSSLTSFDPIFRPQASTYHSQMKFMLHEKRF